jgi:hypothetical protein
MYFPISNHYLDDFYKTDNNSDNIEKNECLICLEINGNDDNICIRIENHFYIKECLCDGWVHEYCLNIWYIKNNKCPICLCNMIKDDLDDNETQIENDDNNASHINNLFLLIKYLLLVYIFIIFIIFSYYNIENMVMIRSTYHN